MVSAKKLMVLGFVIFFLGMSVNTKASGDGVPYFGDTYEDEITTPPDSYAEYYDENDDDGDNDDEDERGEIASETPLRDDKKFADLTWSQRFERMLTWSMGFRT